MPLNFNKPKKEVLMYGLRACPKNHTDMQGRVVRRRSGGCWACSCGLPEGKFNFDFGELPQQHYGYHGKYKTDEEKRQARIEAQVRWNTKNKERHRAYQKIYDAKPEVKARRSAIAAAYYQEHKEELKAKNIANYHKRKAKNEHARQEAERQRTSTGSESVDT